MSAPPSNGHPPASRRLAAIDIGSNSIRLMIAEATPDGNYRVLDDEKETTRLAQGLAETGELSEEAISQSLDALARMKSIVEGYAVDALEVIATSAVREASNRRKFVKTVKDRLGLQVEVISTEDEGMLSFRSVERHFDLRDLNAVIVDFGGGSAELVFAAHGIVETVISLPIGSVRMTERFIRSDPPTDADCERVQKEVRLRYTAATPPIPPL